MPTLTRYFTVQQWTEHNPWPSLGGLRHLIFYAKDNGFESVIRRVGRRVLIDEVAFHAWIDRQGTRNGQESSRSASSGRRD